MAHAAAAETCTARVLAAEQRYHIPTGLLLALSLVESGQNGEPQAYAMNLQGRALVASSYEDAAKHLHDSHGRILSNVMAGCMQLSVSAHKAAFSPVDRIMEPDSNVDYGAHLLRRLYDDEGSWSAALARYNGATPSARNQYVCRVWRALSGLDHASADVLDGRNCTDGQQVSIAPQNPPRLPGKARSRCFPAAGKSRRRPLKAAVAENPPLDQVLPDGAA